MNIIPIKTPGIVKKLFPNYIWNISKIEKVIYLTFDDGPTPNITRWTLNILKQYDAKATFFCIGNNIEKHPDIFKDIVSAGHAIGNHTQNHIKGWRHSTKNYLKEVKKTNSIIKSQITESNSENLCSKNKFSRKQTKLTNNTSTNILATYLFRPPYGQIKPAQGRALIANGYKIIMWDILSFDWDINVQPKDCLRNVLLKTKPGSILVFHDSIKASKNMQFMLPKVLSYFSEKGYRFERL